MYASGEDQFPDSKRGDPVEVRPASTRIAYPVRMETTYEYAKPADEAEMAALGSILIQCFNAPESFWPGYVEQTGAETFRVLRREGTIVGGLAAIPMGHWFGGRSVSTAGIAAVGIAPEVRGHDAARALMTETLREQHAAGTSLSTLFSAAHRLYRRVGYEVAGSLCDFEIAADAVGIADRDLPIRALDLGDLTIPIELDRRRARRSAGNLDRGRAIWHMITHYSEGPVRGYVVGDEKDPEGYVVFRQAASKTERDYDLLIRDLVALTPAAYRRIWTLLADHRSQTGVIRWAGPASDPHLMVFPEHRHRIRDLEHWHLRILNVASALETRGYPAGVEEELHLDISDETIPENAGRFLLRVADGRGSVEPGGRGDLSGDIRALAPLYSGLHRAGTLTRLGMLRGDRVTLDAAERIFAGPEPWMPDSF
jgi:predicted acetyltransferase